MQELTVCNHCENGCIVDYEYGESEARGSAAFEKMCKYCSGRDIPADDLEAWNEHVMGTRSRCRELSKLFASIADRYNKPLRSMYLNHLKEGLLPSVQELIEFIESKGNTHEQN